MKNEITYNEYMMLAGLMALGQQAAKRTSESVKAIANLLEDHDTDFYEPLVEGWTVQQLIGELGIVVKRVEMAAASQRPGEVG